MPHTTADSKLLLKACVNEFCIPPISDGLVLGKKSPIGCIAIRRALELLMVPPFERIEIDDDIISDILVRESVLRRISRECLIEFVRNRIKPMMGPEEILHIELTVDMLIEDDGS